MEKKKRQKDIEKLVEDYPDIPSEIYDIEASVEMAEIYQDMLGA